MVEFLALGDTHVWPELGAFSRFPGMANDSFRAFTDIIRTTEPFDTVLLLAGDVFEHSHRHGLTAAMQHVANARKSPDTTSDWRTLFIQGNHDAVSVGMPPFMGFCGGKRLTRDALEFYPSDTSTEVRIAGLDYTRDVEQLYADLDYVRQQKPDILLLHQGVDALLGFDGAFELKLDDLDGVADIIVCGHVHTPVVKELKSGTIFISPGSTIPRNCTELGALASNGFAMTSHFGGFILRRESSNSEWQIERRLVPNSRQYARFNVSTEAQLHEIKKTVTAVHETAHKKCEETGFPYVRVQFNAENVSAGQLKDALGNVCYLDAVPYTVMSEEDVTKGVEEDVESIVREHVDPENVRLFRTGMQAATAALQGGSVAGILDAEIEGVYRDHAVVSV